MNKKEDCSRCGRNFRINKRRGRFEKFNYNGEKICGRCYQKNKIHGVFATIKPPELVSVFRKIKDHKKQVISTATNNYLKTVTVEELWHRVGYIPEGGQNEI